MRKGSDQQQRDEIIIRRLGNAYPVHSVVFADDARP